MVPTARTSSVNDRFASASSQRDHMPNAADHRYTGNAAHLRYAGRHTIVHRVADRGVVLRRVAARRRLARIDPEIVERRAWRLTGGGGGGGGGGGASSPTHP